MKNMPPFTWGTLFCLVLVMSCAAGARAWYLVECADSGSGTPALQVQGAPPPETTELVANLIEYRAFDCLAPLAAKEEATAHMAPGYPLFLAMFNSPDADAIVRWVQGVLGALTSACYFFFARRIFHSTFAAMLAGVLTAFYPFWIINTAEINDGVLATFLVGASLALGARGGQTGGAFTGLAFGLTLAATALVRAAFLPFAIVSLLWFLWECRRFPVGWLAGLLALIAFVGGIAPWTIRNYVILEEPIPIVDSAYLHLWMGNNSAFTGSTLDPAKALPKDRLDELLDEKIQARRYDMLATDVQQEIQDYPTETLTRRIKCFGVFFVGDRGFREGKLARTADEGAQASEAPAWLTDNIELILQATLVGVVLLALLGWRFSFPLQRPGRLAVIAIVMVPLPYVLAHAEVQSGPRLPLDGVLLCYAAYALACFVPGFLRSGKSNGHV